MRGLVPSYMMQQIEKMTGRSITDLVDIFCGPSTGAILNAALNVPHPEDPTKPKYTPKHMIRFYKQDGLKIFPPDRFRDFRGLIHDFNNRTMKISQLNKLFRHGHYKPKHLHRSLQALYGDHKLSNSLKSLIVPVYNIDGSHLSVAKEKDERADSPVRTKNNFMDEGGYALWLKNMKTGTNDAPAPEVSMVDAVMASCAAPSYFPSHSFDVTYPEERGTQTYTGIDGSIFDNPCISYHGAIRRHLPKDARIIFILLGTGYTLKNIHRDEWNSYGGLGIVDPVNDLPLINIFFHAPESALVENFTHEIGDDLYIFNKSIYSASSKASTPSLQIDDASESTLNALELFAHEMIEERANDLERLCQTLVSLKDEKNNQKSGFFRSLSKYFS